MFCFIGAEPATGWLAGIATGDDGFIRTDVHSGSMKPVAAATGEGASAIASVHKAIATLA